MNSIEIIKSWLLRIITNKIVLILNVENPILCENFKIKMLITVNTTEYRKNNSSFEMPNSRLAFGTQNISILDASIITKIPHMQTKNNKAFDLNDPTLSTSFLLVFI
jgi:hypothetical protein